MVVSEYVQALAHHLILKYATQPYAQVIGALHKFSNAVWGWGMRSGQNQCKICIMHKLCTLKLHTL